MKKLLNKEIKKITINQDIDEIKIYFEDNSSYRFYHDQDCCEMVYMENGSIKGFNTKNLKGSKFIYFKEISHDDTGKYGKEMQWTFYNWVSTNGDSGSIRWMGSSNGYYSIRVDFEEMSKGVQNEKNNSK